MPTIDGEQMVCMEVWGGNAPAQSSVTMAGLDAWVYCKPFEADEGGDVYFVSSCATGRITRLLLADVAGHGSAVSDVATSLRRLMRKYVNYINQTAFVRAMNQQFTQLSTGGQFATAIVCTFFGPTRDVTLCVAGHPPPLLYRARDKTWIALDASHIGEAQNLPLGIDDVEDWGQYGLRLAMGDFLFCYTDCLIESRDPAGEMLGVTGLTQLAMTVPISQPDRFISNLLSAIEQRCGGKPFTDDVTALLFGPNASAPQLPLGQRLLAPLRIVGSVIRSIGSRANPASWPEMSVTNLLGTYIAPLNRLWSKRNRTENR